MSNGEYEFNPKEMSTLSHYFSDVHLGLDDGFENRSDIQTSLSKLFIGEGILTEDSNMDILYTYVDSILEPNQDRRIQFEQFMLLPLREIAPYIELTRSPKEVAKWYEENLGFIKEFNEPYHDFACIEQSVAEEADSCINSKECPLVVTAIALTTDVHVPEFSNLGYTVDNRRTFKIAMKKLAIAEDDSILSFACSKWKKDMYLKDYRHYFPDFAEAEKPESQT